MLLLYTAYNLRPNFLRFSRTWSGTWTTAFGRLKWVLAGQLKLCTSLSAFLLLRIFKSFTNVLSAEGGYGSFLNKMSYFQLWSTNASQHVKHCCLILFRQMPYTEWESKTQSKSERLWCSELIRVPECWGKQKQDFRFPIDFYKDLSSIEHFQSAQESQRGHDSFRQTRVWENP